jgi:flavodoxin
MKVLIIFDSIFGNTAQIAHAMGNALQSHAFVRVVKVSEFTLEQLNDTHFLIIGSPTRGFRATPAINDLLKSLPVDSLAGLQTACFDTRLNLDDVKSGFVHFIVKNGGYAGKRIADAHKKKGAAPLLEPEGFFVSAEEGPLRTGELERAGEWANQLISQTS